ncbi:MAG: hypothetical protein Q8Q62_20150 [Mesorhizobium sp.]|nr:hypothetical protein [Mesorhizobium sp.]
MISLMYRSFGADPPQDLDGVRGAMLWLLALVFVVASVAILAIINFFSLFFGVTVSFLGRDGVKFHFLHLFRRIPLIGFTAPILLGYAVWHNAKLSGALAIAMPALLTAAVAVGLLAGVIAVNTLLGTGPRNR